MPLVECMSTGAGLAKRFIARNKLFPVIVSYYKTLVPLFFRSVLGNVDPTSACLFTRLRILLVSLLFQFYLYEIVCIYNYFFDIRLFTKFVLNQKY